MTGMACAGYVGIKFECADLVGNAATSVSYSLWIQGSGPLLYGFVPTPSVWVSAAASANMTVTVRGKREKWRRGKQNAGGAPLSMTSVRYRISRNSGRSWEAWLDVASVSGSTFRTGALGAGANRVQFIAADIVANMANLTSSVSVDSVAPVVQRVRADSVGEVEHCGERDDHGHAVWDGDSDGEVRADDRREQLWGVGGSGDHTMRMELRRHTGCQ